VTPISTRALGRTLLARQHLLDRVASTPVAMAEHLVGMQAQEPRDPYLALWSRLDPFEPGDLEAALLDRALVRMVATRGTIHLLSADDAVGLRSLFQPVLDGEMARHSQHKAALAGVDLAPVSTFARELLDEPLPVPRLREALAQRFPQHDPAALAFACRNTVPLVQAPPRGLWSRGGAVTYVTVEHWLDRPTRAATIDDVALRYLRAFGPATVADFATWTRLTHLREVFDRLAPQLRTWRDERGRELFDLATGRIVDDDVPAPVRFLPEYDNVLLSHADRSRITGGLPADLYPADAHGIGHVLVDGRVRATWRLHPRRTRGGDDAQAVVAITHAGLAKRHQAAVMAEAQRALPILSRGTGADVQMAAVPV
jgi:Winged helix DNA-binding domain